jgi:predicted kinase
MPDRKPTLHLLCGKIASGKSTLAAELAALPGHLSVSEDSWLARLYPGDIRSVSDYVRCSGRLREAVGPHLVDLLRQGVSVVLDFPANTVATRQWMRSLFEQADAAHQLHVLDVPDEVCKARLQIRNAACAHDFSVSEAEFDLITSHCAAPSPDEGFNIIRHGGVAG